MSKKKNKSTDKENSWERCPECRERVPPEEMPQHAKNCCTDTDIKWVWGEAKGRGINEKVEENVAVLVSLLGGGEEYCIKHETTKNNLMEVIVTIVDPDADITINILFRYSERWGEDDLPPSKVFYLGLQRTSSRVSRHHFNKISDILCDTATNEAGDDLSCWVWNVSLQFRDRFICFIKEDKLTFHDAAMIPKCASGDSQQYQIGVGQDDFSEQQPSIEEPFFSKDMQQNQEDNTNADIQESIQNIRTKRATNSVFFRDDGMWGGSSPNFRSVPDDADNDENDEEEDFFGDSDSPAESSKSETTSQSEAASDTTDSSSDGGKLGDRCWGTVPAATTATTTATTTTEESTSTDSDSSGSSNDGKQWGDQPNYKYGESNSSDSSSSGGKLGDRWDRQATQKQRQVTSDEYDSSSAPRQQKRKKKTAKTSFGSTNSPRTVKSSAVITPQEQRAQIALRYLINNCRVDEPVRDAIVAQLEDFEFLSSHISADPQFTKGLSEFISQGSFAIPATHRHPQDHKKVSWFKGNFRIIKQLGEGGQGRVYQVQNKTDGLYYAVKRVELRGKRDDIDRYAPKQLIEFYFIKEIQL